MAIKLPMKNVRMLCLMSGIIIFLNSCDRDPTKPGLQFKKPKQVNLRFELGEAKDYLWAKPGSYWIYKDSVTGNLDTQTVTGFLFDTQIIKGTREETKHITIEFDRLRRNIYSSFHNKSYYDETLSPTPDGTSFDNTFRIILMRNGASPFVSFFHPFQLNAASGSSGTNTFCKSLNSSTTLQGELYSNVVGFEISHELTWSIAPPYASCKYYWSKEAGLIKMAVAKITSENWKLIEWNVIQ